MIRYILFFIFIYSTALFSSTLSRIKDLVDFEGVRDNHLVGYGLVFGLNGTGDKLNNSVFTRESIVGIMERLGVSARDSSLNTRNVAAVMVTATLKPFSRQGTKMDVHISAVGDATNLQGGVLVATPLKGADGQVYAVAQGPVSVAGFAAKGAGTSVTQGNPTSGHIVNGALIEKEMHFSMNHQEVLRLFLRNPDFTTATRIRNEIQKKLAPKNKYYTPIIHLIDAGTLSIRVPAFYKNQVSRLVSDIEQILVAPDDQARIVIKKSSGVIIMGENVKIHRVAIAHGNLTIKVTENPLVSQPNPFTQNGQTTTVARTTIEVKEEDKKMTIVNSGAHLRDLVNNLNALGVSTADMIEILETMKYAGAIHAKLETI